MEGKNRRFTISVPRDLASEIAAARESGYIEGTQEEVLRRLIIRGVRMWKQQSGNQEHRSIT